MKTKGILLILLGASSFGLTPIFVKKGFEYGYTLGHVNLIQMAFALVIMGAILLFKGLSLKTLAKQDRLKVLLTGSTVGLTSIFYYGAMQYLSASLAIILLFQFVWIGMIYEWIFGKQRPTRINLLSLIVTLVGVFFASNVLHGGILEIPFIGVLLGFLAGVTYAGFIYFSGQVATDTDPLVRTTWMVIGSTTLILVVFFKDIPTLEVGDPRLWWIGIGIALVGAVIPPLTFAIGAPLISGRLANVLSSVELPVAILSAMVVLSETVTVSQWLGITLIIAAIFINELGGIWLRKTKKRLPE